MKKTIIPFDDYNHRLHPGSEIVGSVLPTWGNFALTNGWKLIEIYDDDDSSDRRFQWEDSFL